jgi:hypothetical protein
MDEVSQLKLTMVGMEESHDTHQHTRPESPERKQNKAEVGGGRTGCDVMCSTSNVFV